MYKFIPIILLFVSLYFYAHGTDDRSNGHPLGHDERLNNLETQLSELRKQHLIPGMAVGVVKDGELLWSKNYGHADVSRTVPITNDTPFWIASITKTFVGLSFLHLAEQNEINLNDLASETPDFLALCDWLSESGIAFSNGLDCAEPISIDHILKHQVNKPVGTSFMYNPIMYSRLSRYLEHLQGNDVKDIEGRHNYLAQSIDKYILKPANMQRTMASMWDRSKMDVFYDLSDGYKIDIEKGSKTKLRTPEKHIAGGAGVVSTLSDLVKYDAAISSKLIAPHTIFEKLHKPATFKNGEQSVYGYGWYFQTYRGESLMWHSGWDPDAGFSSIMIRLPQRNLSFIILANSEGLWWQNPIDQARIEQSEFVQAFFNTVVF
ncbi:serine hydrolase domain-containing protein [Ningiella sp. W23]|uniref:serine hydrolase domain-containing protein n=1 Tax=Ningiella sp. W23 TaxID=3023715 RepID=UPI00375645F7